MKTQITRYFGSFALAAALLTSSTAAFAATPSSTNPVLYDAAQPGDDVANGLDFGGDGLGVGAAIVGVAAGTTDAGLPTAGGLSIGDTGLTNVAAPIVQFATR